LEARGEDDGEGCAPASSTDDGKSHVFHGSGKDKSTLHWSRGVAPSRLRADMPREQVLT
jgi:hypothetical protein